MPQIHNRGRCLTGNAAPKRCSRSRGSSVPLPAATFREEMAARGGFQSAPTGGGGGAMGPGPPVPGAGPGMGPGTPSGRMGPSPAAQNHMYRSPMPGPGYPVRYRSIFAADALACPLEQSLLPPLCHCQLSLAHPQARATVYTIWQPSQKLVTFQTYLNCSLQLTIRVCLNLLVTC